MAIRNASLGGSDWGNEELTSTDLNDTFDAVVNKVQTLSAFWLNSDLYDVYDDFDSYSTGAFTTNTNWTVSLSQTGYEIAYANISNTQNAGGSTNELHLYTGRTFSNSGSSTSNSTAYTKN